MIVICIIVYILYIRINECEYSENLNKKSAVCCLTRGYKNKSRYNDLIKRNEHLSQLDWAKSYDHIIFHEGNISKKHQVYIANKTTLPIRFVSIKDTFFRKSNTVVDNGTCKHMPEWPSGYKRMCRFWFVDFWNYVKEYEYIIRFDEDVHVGHECKVPIEHCKTHGLHYVCPFLMNEPRDVIDGLHNLIGKSYDDINRVPGTHTQMIHIPYYMNNTEANDFIRKIDQSGCILHNRWGDAPLMGILVREFTNPTEYDFNWKGFVGYHGSHSHTF